MTRAIVHSNPRCSKTASGARSTKRDPAQVVGAYAVA
jgi:hypothetical protein